MKAPSCIGYYEPGDDQCDGRQYGHSVKACLIRSQCRKIQKYQLRIKNRASEILNGQSLEEVERFIKHMNDGGEVDSFIYGRTPKTVRSIRQKHNSQECWSLYRHFENQLVDRFGVSMLANRLCDDTQNLVVFIEGTLYPVDRTQNKIAYVLWYCKINKGYDTLVCKVYFRSRSKTLDISVPIDINVLNEVFSSVTMKKLSAVPIEEGLLKTTFKHLSYEGVGLTVVCLKRLVDRNIFELPRKKL
jgi:hypothetical protein